MSTKDNKHSQSGQPRNEQGSSFENKNIDPNKRYMPDGTEEPSKEGNYDQNGNEADTDVKIDDNPAETEKKLPHM